MPILKFKNPLTITGSDGFISNILNMDGTVRQTNILEIGQDIGTDQDVTFNSVESPENQTLVINNEAGTQTGLSYLDSYDQGQSTDFIRLCEDTSAANADENLSGEVRIFNPADTTFVKHYLGTSQTATAKVGQVYSLHWFGGGYFNTTSALNAFQFKFNSGNIDSGTIKLYGVT